MPILMLKAVAEALFRNKGTLFIQYRSIVSCMFCIKAFMVGLHVCCINVCKYILPQPGLVLVFCELYS